MKNKTLLSASLALVMAMPADTASAQGTIEDFNKAYALDPTDNTTTYFMFVTNLLRMNCVKAWEYHDLAVAQNGRSIEEQYRLMLNESCKR